MGKIVLTDYSVVVEIMSWARKFKKAISVERKGNDWVGVYWEIETKNTPKDVSRNSKQYLNTSTSKGNKQIGRAHV